MISAPPRAILTRKGVTRFRSGHPWIYKSDIEALHGASNGCVVRVEDSRGWHLGSAFYSETSQISLRWLTWENEPIDDAFFARRLAAALRARSVLAPGRSTYRWFHGESDGIPGLVIDRFEDVVSVQLLTPATDARRAFFVQQIQELTKPRLIVERSDVNVRKLEGLPLVKGILSGSGAARVAYREGEVQLEVDVLEGQKTGAFLDQTENHLAVRDYAFGEALDCFSYTGGFALQLAQVAAKVTALEVSEAACGLIRQNASRNGFENLEVQCANVFDVLRDQLDAGVRYDTIVLDPPSFAKNKGAIEAATRGYKELNLRAMQLLRPGGILVSASCTYHVGEQAFEDMLVSAAADAKRRVQLVEKRGASRDHPVLIGLPESRYLKCFILRVH